MNNRLFVTAALIVLTIISGYGDSQGFLFASRIWDQNRVNWDAMLKSGLGYAFGVGVFWLSIRFFNALGINSPELQTIGWFAVTIIGVALFSGDFLKWGALDKALGLIALVSVGLLMFRRGG